MLHKNLIFLLGLPLSIYAQNDFGELEGVLRGYHVFSPSYIKSGRSEDYAVNGSTIGGHLRYRSPTYNGFGLTTALYYSMGTGLNDKDDANTIMATGRFFTKDYSPKAVLGELNIHYKDETQTSTLGHFKIDSPLTNSIYTYMPNMFEALLYENRSFEKMTLTVAKVDKMAYATRTPVEFGMIGEATRTAGTTQSGINTRGQFRDIGSQTLADDSKDTNGLYVLGVKDNSLEDVKLQAWNFYADNIINMFYADASYKTTDSPYAFAAQYLRVDGIGDNLGDSLLDKSSAYMLGLKSSFQYKDALFYLAYNHSGDAKLLNAWGGDPAYTSSVFSRNAYRANVDAYKVGFDYKVSKDFKIKNSYANYGQSTTEGTFVPSRPLQVLSSPDTDAIEYDMVFLYNITKDLHFLGLISYKESEYYYANKTVEFVDVDMVLTYKF
jgi:hypothetical protein